MKADAGKRAAPPAAAEEAPDGKKAKVETKTDEGKSLKARMESALVMCFADPGPDAAVQAIASLPEVKPVQLAAVRRLAESAVGPSDWSAAAAALRSAAKGADAEMLIAVSDAAMKVPPGEGAELMDALLESGVEVTQAAEGAVRAASAVYAGGSEFWAKKERVRWLATIAEDCAWRESIVAPSVELLGRLPPGSLAPAVGSLVNVMRARGPACRVFAEAARALRGVMAEDPASLEAARFLRVLPIARASECGEAREIVNMLSS